MGRKQGNVSPQLATATPLFHLIEWANHRWEDSLLVYVEARLYDLDDTLRTIGTSSYLAYVKYICAIAPR